MHKEVQEIQELTYTLSFELGQSMAHGLYRNYPDGFNAEIKELARRLYEKGYRKLPKDKPHLLSDDIGDCLDCAREAIVDAICCEDGLDGGAGEKVIKWITDILGDYDEWIKTHSDD